jgi:phosphoribosylformylglycinamidine synthase
VLLGSTLAEVGGSEWATAHGLRGGTPPTVDLDGAQRLHDLVRTLVVERVVRGVHDCADGGLAVTVAEMAIAGGTGVSLTLEHAALEWFSETASRVVLSVVADRVDEVVARAAEGGVPAAVIGTAGGARLRSSAFDVSLADAADAWRGGIPRVIGNDPVPA